MAPTWPHVVHALLQRFITDEVLQTAYDALTRATQETNEDEVSFAQCSQEVARVCRHVFTPVEMVNCYIRGLHKLVRECVREEISNLPMNARVNSTLFREHSKAIGNSKRSLVRSFPPPKAPPRARNQRGACSDNTAGRAPPIVAATRLAADHTLHGHRRAFKHVGRRPVRPIAYTYGRATPELARPDTSQPNVTTRRQPGLHGRHSRATGCGVLHYHVSNGGNYQEGRPLCPPHAWTHRSILYRPVHVVAVFYTPPTATPLFDPFWFFWLAIGTLPLCTTTVC